MDNWQIEWGKLAVIGFLMLGGFALVFVALLAPNLADDRFAITLSLGSSIITGVMGYLFGNGRLASKGQVSVPTFAPKSVTDAGNATLVSLVTILLLTAVAVLLVLGMATLGAWIT